MKGNRQMEQKRRNEGKGLFKGKSRNGPSIVRY